MPWEVFKREDTFEGSDQPFVAIQRDVFFFSAVFTRLSGVGVQQQVTIHIDCENRKIGFEFHDERKSSSFCLYRGGPHGAEKSSGLRCSSKALVRDFEWIRSITRLSSKERRFVPRKEGNLWVIQLCPAFEEQRARESKDIPSDVCGIYRYVRENGEIVYIGRGEIRCRLASPERAEWDFDRIEYSVVNDPDQQVKWEAYWIDRFKEENRGKLPFYNRISGSKTKEDDDSDG